jgi:phosphatidylinositol alpha-1,6-mannosyltransferase
MEQAPGFQDAPGVRRLPWLEFRNWGPDSPGRLWQYAACVWTLRRHVQRTGCQVVLCGRALPEGLIARAAGRTPYVCLAHGEEIPACQTSGLLTRLLRSTYRHAAGVIANTRTTAQLAIGAGAPRERVEVVPPGVDFASYASAKPALRSAYGLRPDVPVVLTVGRLEMRKNHAGVLEALAVLKRQQVAAHYLIVGQGSQRRSLGQRVADLGLQDCVQFLENVPDADLPGLYKMADMFAMPTIQSPSDLEGFGIVYIEAAAAGLPCIAGQGGPAEAVRDGETGFVVPGHDPAALAASLGRLLREVALRRQMGAAAVEWARKFDWPIVVCRLAAALDRLAGPGTAGGERP